MLLCPESNLQIHQPDDTKNYQVGGNDVSHEFWHEENGDACNQGDYGRELQVDSHKYSLYQVVCKTNPGIMDMSQSKCPISSYHVRVKKEYNKNSAILIMLRQDKCCNAGSP